MLDGVLGPARQVGRYFALVSGVTSLVPVLFIGAVLASGAPGRRPDLATLSNAIRNGGFLAAAGVALAVLLTGLALHPLQFALTQALEGYWGTGSWAQRGMRRSVALQQRRWYRLEQLVHDADESLAPLDEKMALLDEAAGLAFVSPLRRRELRAERTAVVRAGRRWLLQRQEAARALGRFPDAVDVMPTRLGNVLRRHERFSGAPFGLEATTVIPYVALVGDPAHRAYLDDMRGAMDLSVRLTLAWAICCGAGIVMLWPYDVWLVLPLSAYLLAWLSYRGAVAAAAFYGGAMALVIALGRRSLYDKLGVGLPRDTESERYRNFDLVRLLRGELSSVPYEWGASAGIPDSGPVETDPLLPSDAYLP